MKKSVSCMLLHYAAMVKSNRRNICRGRLRKGGPPVRSEEGTIGVRVIDRRVAFFEGGGGLGGYLREKKAESSRWERAGGKIQGSRTCEPTSPCKPFPSQNVDTKWAIRYGFNPQLCYLTS